MSIAEESTSRGRSATIRGSSGIPVEIGRSSGIRKRLILSVVGTGEVTAGSDTSGGIGRRGPDTLRLTGDDVAMGLDTDGG